MFFIEDLLVSSQVVGPNRFFDARAADISRILIAPSMVCRDSGRVFCARPRGMADETEKTHSRHYILSSAQISVPLTRRVAAGERIIVP